VDNSKAKDNLNAPLRLEMMKTFFQGLMSADNYRKLNLLDSAVIEPIYNGAVRMNPDTIFINTGSEEDLDYIRRRALENGEETSLLKKGHSYHFDGPEDQGRDTANTKYLAYDDTEISSLQKKVDHRVGILEVRDIMNDIMKGSEMVVSFISRGPVDCAVSDPTLQLTDSYYVTHSEFILYRMVTPEEFSRDVLEKGYMFLRGWLVGLW